eukprot:2813132-Rhodomonas_salina.1
MISDTDDQYASLRHRISVGSSQADRRLRLRSQTLAFSNRHAHAQILYQTCTSSNRRVQTVYSRYPLTDSPGPTHPRACRGYPWSRPAARLPGTSTAWPSPASPTLPGINLSHTRARTRAHTQ